VSRVLEVRDLKKRFAGIAAVDGIDLSAESLEILAIIGPNGSGKTTLFNLISGFLKPTAGDILLNGERINGIPPHRLVRRGLARSFQQAMSFPNLSVRDNVEVPIHASGRRHLGDVTRILELCGLSEQEHMPANTLPYGKQRNLGIAIAMATRPQLLLLDEPAAGLGDDAARDLARLIRSIREQGVTLVVIDHDMPFLLPIADRVIVMETGKKLFEGTAADVLAHERVIEVYLGHDAE